MRDNGPGAAPELPAPLTFTSFRQQRWLRHGITRRAPGWWRDGDISYATGGDAAAVFASRQRWAHALGLEATRIVAARQVHGKGVAVVTAADRGRGARSLAEAIPESDALLTSEPGLPLLLSFADCTPLLFCDPVRRVVGLAHAGWRGTVADIAGATVAALTRHYGSRPGDLLVAIGPAIGDCCYVVDEPVVAAWRAIAPTTNEPLTEIAPRDGQRQWRFSLARANRSLLEEAGVPATQIEEAGICTACSVADYPSHRAEAGHAGRFAALIGIDRSEVSR